MCMSYKKILHISSKPSDIPTEKGRLDPVERDEYPVPRRDLLHNVDGPPQQEGRRARPRADSGVTYLNLGQGLPAAHVREEPEIQKCELRRVLATAQAEPRSDGCLRLGR